MSAETAPLAYVRGDIAEILAQRVRDAAHRSLNVDLEDALIRPSSAGRGGDYQSNAAMSLGKKLGRAPRIVAEAIVSALQSDDVASEVTIGGPGFINFVLRDDWLGAQVAGQLADAQLGVPQSEQPKRVVLDLSGPNVSKEMHVGHLRSTIIGDALVRLLRAVGHDVIPQNHVGDWGTPFGMLLEHLHDVGSASGAKHSISDLNTFYQQARTKFDADEGFAERARRRVVALQGGEPDTVALWKELFEESERHFMAVYELLGVGLTPQDTKGESSYNDVLPEIAAELEDRKLAVISGGALCAFPKGFTNKEGEPMPLIIRKSDGGYTYDTTDMATARYRAQVLKADDMIYVVDAGQNLHFEMIFTMAREAGWVPDSTRTVHVTFGVVLGEDGKRLRTRAGDSVKLVDLLEEAVERAGEVVADRSELSPQERAEVARAVGIGAVKYADLSSDRDKDYIFSWKRMLAMDGNTAVYLQYANARIHSVLRKAGAAVSTGEGRVVLDAPAERALALSLARFPAAVLSAVENLQPHRLCTYLYELATAFSHFYETCPIANETNEKVRASRLELSSATSAVLEKGLDLLGIATPHRL